MSQLLDILLQQEKFKPSVEDSEGLIKAPLLPQCVQDGGWNTPQK